MLFTMYKSTCNLYHFIMSKCIVYLGHKCMLKPFKSSFNAINPLNPNIKIQILICCPYTFSIEEVGRIC